LGVASLGSLLASNAAAGSWKGLEALAADFFAALLARGVDSGVESSQSGFNLKQVSTHGAAKASGQLSLEHFAGQVAVLSTRGIG